MFMPETSFKSKKVLVIGGAGFIGSHLIEKLLEASSEVTSLDNYSTGKIENEIQGASYITGEAVNIKQYFTDSNFDYIFHLGEFSRVEMSFAHIDAVLKNNLSSFLEVISFAKDQNAKLIYSGSSTKFSVEESESLQSPYSLSKAHNTYLLNNYAKWTGLNYCITYYYNVYGGREIGEGDFSTVVAKFLNLKKQGKTKLPVTKPGTQRRNFTHIDDIVSGVILVALKGKGDNYGIGAEEDYSILDLVKMIDLEPELIKSSPGNRITTKLKTEKTKSLGWKPLKNLENYLSNIS